MRGEQSLVLRYTEQCGNTPDVLVDVKEDIVLPTVESRPQGSTLTGTKV
jgi:hypothetical protein